LWRPKDKLKDQTYFLYTLDQDKLRRLIFPLSGLTKAQVRNLAEKYELKVAAKPESQEICFVPEKSHNDFLKRNLKLQPGKILSLSGEFLGEHQGLPLYTVGQRRGLEIGGTGPYYAVRFDWNNNILYVSSKLEDDALFKITLQVRDLSWIGKKPKKSFSCLASIRYRQEAEKAKVVIDKDQVGVIFAKPQRAITPGQSIVFYHGNRLLGGGIIDRVE
jgi:tRNA-specific 2-thiouridylase